MHSWPSTQQRRDSSSDDVTRDLLAEAMSLLDEWETGGQPYGDVRHELDPVLSDEGSDTELVSPHASVPHVIFSVETVERHLAR